MKGTRKKGDKGTTRQKTLDEVLAQYREQNLVLAVSGSLEVLAKGKDCQWGAACSQKA